MRVQSYDASKFFTSDMLKRSSEMCIQAVVTRYRPKTVDPHRAGLWSTWGNLDRMTTKRFFLSIK